MDSQDFNMVSLSLISVPLDKNFDIKQKWTFRYMLVTCNTSFVLLGPSGEGQGRLVDKG